MSDASSEFDDYEHTYRGAVDDAIRFSHQGHEFFTRAKVGHLVELVGRRLGPPSTTTVLDVGCGPGATDALLAPHVDALHGVDISEGMVAEARRTNPAGTYATYDGEHLPFDDDTFDVAFAICVLHHVEPAGWQAFASEMARVVRPGGLTVVFEHNPYNPLTRKAVNDCPFDEGVTLLSRRTTSGLLRGAGLQVVEGRYILFLPFGQQASHAVDKGLRWLPMGGQYMVAATSGDTRG